MIRFTTTIQKFGQQGEKTGWTYITITAPIAEQLKPGQRTSFRVKGSLDAMPIEQVALLPMGEGAFILPLKAALLKRLGKRKGDTIEVHLEADDRAYAFLPELMDCLADEPVALERFKAQPGSHQRYFNNWISSAKGEDTRAKRIAHTVNAMLKGQNYGEMIRSLKGER